MTTCSGCFAYRGNECLALNSPQDPCNFKKTKAEYERGRKAAAKRLRKMFQLGELDVKDFTPDMEKKILEIIKEGK